MRVEFNRGTVAIVRNGRGDVLGFKALLPRALSRPPEGCKNPSRYQEQIGNLHPTKDAARRLLDAAVVELRNDPTAGCGLTFGDYAMSEIQARKRAAKKVYGSEAAANRRVATWRSVESRWLRKAPFFDWLPNAIEHSDLHKWFTYLTDEAENKAGEPVSASFVRQVASFCRAIFLRALPDKPHPIARVKLPKKETPKVPYLGIAAQRGVFSAGKIELSDRVMVGCGLGTGLRVGELLAIEADDVHLDDTNPHLSVRFGMVGPIMHRPKAAVNVAWSCSSRASGSGDCG
jgi:hypothetical protein